MTLRPRYPLPLNQSGNVAAPVTPQRTMDGTNSNIEIEVLTPAIGAIVHGVDLSKPLTGDQYAPIERAFLDHQVIFFRQQHVAKEDLKRFGRHFGTLNVHPFLPKVERDPKVILLHNDRKRPAAVNVWHADLTFMQKPPLGAVLVARQVPDAGGDTLWASMYAAYDGLTSDMQRRLSSLTAVHRGSLAAYRAALGDHAPLDPNSEWANPNPSAEHPVVRTHPVTGRKSLFVSSADTRAIKGMKPGESDDLLQILFRHAETPEFQVRFRWRAGDVAFWDNRCTQHYAAADYWPQERIMHRVTVEGERPF